MALYNDSISMLSGNYGMIPAQGNYTKTETNNSNQDVFAEERAKLEEGARKAREEYEKSIELKLLKAQYEQEFNALKEQQEAAEKTRNNLNKSKNSKGSATLDSGETGFKRWLGNAGTALVNMGKSFIGMDKEGNIDPLICGINVGLTAVAIGLMFTGYGAPIGAGLLALGVGGGTIGLVKGISDLNEAKKKMDQAKIDEAQQDICSNAFIIGTSLLGAKSIGSLFRTSSSTAELASAASKGTSFAGKAVEGISNFGRDITVNAFRATKHATVNKIPPLKMSAFKGWNKQFKIQSRDYKTVLNNKLTSVQEKLLTETDAAKRALLLEEKSFLEANLNEFNNIGKTIKSKAEFDALYKDNMAGFNQEYVQSAYNMNPAGEYNINGAIVKEQELLNFQNRIVKQQRALEKELHQLIKAKENMMRTLARNPKKYQAQLNKYISTTNVKRSLWKPSTWVKSKEAIAINGKNPSYTLKTLNYALTSPASNVGKISGAWVRPIHSSPLLLTAELSPEETTAQLESMDTAIEAIKNIRIKLETASTKEEFENAMNEYNQMVLAAQQAQQIEQNPQLQEETLQALQQSAPTTV